MENQTVDWEEFEEQLNAYCKKEAEEDVSKMPPSALESQQQRVEKLQKEKFESALEFKTLLKYGWKVLLSYAQKHKPEVYQKASFLLQISSQIWDKEGGVEGKRPLGKVAKEFDWPDELMQELYLIAAEHYKKKLFDEAAASFTVLVSWDHENSDYWVGLGLVKQIGFKEYLQACDYFFRAMDLNPSNPYVYVYYAECLHKLGHDQKILLHFLDLALDTMNEGENIEDLRAYCVALKIQLGSQLGG